MNNPSSSCILTIAVLPSYSKATTSPFFNLLKSVMLLFCSIESMIKNCPLSSLEAGEDDPPNGTDADRRNVAITGDNDIIGFRQAKDVSPSALYP